MSELDDKTTILAKKLLDSLVGTRNVLGLHDPEDEYHRGKIDGWITAVNWLRRLVCAHAKVAQPAPLTDEQIKAAPQANIQNVSLDMYRAERDWCRDPARVKIGPEFYEAMHAKYKPFTQEEAQRLINIWYESYPGIRAFVDRMREAVKNADGSTSAYGRRRQVGPHGAVGACECGHQCGTPQDSAEPVDRHEEPAGGSGLHPIGSGLARRQAAEADQGGGRGVQGAAAENAEFRAWHIGDPKHRRRFVTGFGQGSKPDDTTT